ncbi:methyltransferase family protein [Sphingomonas crusticola]|uniref:methyltransferase family protein n=1 Tax=Sphingomonas crusticola TaxID=1697973 RepID=UPI000E222EA6|nr:isoprenylcysteine carboxylmethyltransferase family protein [Sphingomonas crusticola]
MINVHQQPIGIPAIVILLVGGLLFLLLLLVRDKRPSSADESGRSRRSILGIAVQILAFVAVGFGPVKPTLPATSVAAVEQAAFVLLLMATTCGLFYASKRAMGRNWSLVARTRSDHELVTWGPFAYIRHPIYSALFTWLLAVAAALGHYWGLVLAVPLYWIGTALRVGEEEKLLRAHFGAAYEAYAARVKRFMPGVI